MNGLSSFTSDEENKWRREEYLNEKAPGLFSLSPKWFKFSGYEVIETKQGLYIAPEKSSKRELYEPFKLFPEILEDYIRMLLSIKRNDEEFQLLNKEQDILKAYQKRDRDQANAILPFVQKYGLFGLLKNSIMGLEPDYKLIRNKDRQDQEPKCNKFIATLYPQSRIYLNGFFLLNHIDSNTYSVEYEKLLSFFLPRLPISTLVINESTSQSDIFYQNYAEPLNAILSGLGMTDISNFEKLFNEYEESGGGLNSPVASIQQKTGNTETTYERVLNFSVNNLGLSIGPEGGKWDLRWTFKSLLTALSIMYIMNKADKMGKKIHICQYSKCNEITYNKYCCPQHSDAARQERCRARKRSGE